MILWFLNLFRRKHHMATNAQVVAGINSAITTLNAAKAYIVANPQIPDQVLTDLSTAVGGVNDAINAANQPPPAPGPSA